MVLLAGQIYQSILIAFVAYAVTVTQDNIIDVFMNFAGESVLKLLNNWSVQRY